MSVSQVKYGPSSADVRLADRLAPAFQAVIAVRLALAQSPDALHVDVDADLAEAETALRRAREKLLSNE